jgi:hypothetical protein
MPANKQSRAWPAPTIQSKSTSPGYPRHPTNYNPTLNTNPFKYAPSGKLSSTG